MEQIDVAAVLAESLSDCKFEYKGEMISPKEALSHNGFLPIISYLAHKYAHSLFGTTFIFDSVRCKNDSEAISGVRSEMQFKSPIDMLMYMLIVHDLMRSINTQYGHVSLMMLMQDGEKLVWPGEHRKPVKDNMVSTDSISI